MKSSYALITGASCGIGLELARIFAKNGYNLILVARQKNKLIEIKKELEEKYKNKIRVIPADLGKADAAEEIFRLLQKKSLSVEYLVNNAGFYVKGPFSNTSWEEEQKLIQIQCVTHTQLTKLFLPGIIKQGRGGILNIGSSGSFVPGPYNAVYCAAKSFVLSFSEALAEEVTGSGITVTALCPGGTRTAFQSFENRNKSILFPLLEPTRVAKTGYDALMKGKRVAIPGLVYKLQILLLRFVPRSVISRLISKMAANSV